MKLLCFFFRYDCLNAVGYFDLREVVRWERLVADPQVSGTVYLKSGGQVRLDLHHLGAMHTKLETLHEEKGEVTMAYTVEPVGLLAESKNLRIDDHTRRLVAEAGIKHGGNRKKMAAELGMSERTLYRWLPPETKKRGGSRRSSAS